MHRKPRPPLHVRITTALDAVRARLTAMSERRRLDAHCTLIEQELAARPWLIRYG